MRSRVLVGFIAALTLAGSAVLAATPTKAASAKLPAIVAAALKSAAATCRDAGGKPQTANAVKRSDLNGDGKDDYVLDVSGIDCDGAASIYGDRDKSVAVYVGDGSGGAREAFNDSVFGVAVEGSGPAAKLWLTVAGTQCGKKPAASFANEQFCDRPLQWNAASGKFVYAPLKSARMIH